MFEISWSELLILGIVTLVFVGPKDLPVFMRTLGRYAGMARKQAAEFRSHFDQAMREAELDGMRKEFESMQTSINSEIMGAKRTFDDVVKDAAPIPVSIEGGSLIRSLIANTTKPPMPMAPSAYITTAAP